MIIDINYLPQNDSILFMKENKLKIIKRDNNGKFNYINLKEINEEKDKNIILIKYDDLKFFTQKFEFEKFLCNSPSQSKFVYVRNFFDGLLHSKKFGNDYILLPIFNGILFFTMVADFLNIKSIISKKQQQLDNIAKEKKDRDKENKESKEKENKPLKDKLTQEAKDNKQLYEELPFSLNYDAESISKDDESDSTISYEQYSDYIINDPLEFSRMRFIVNSIIAQLSIKYPNEKIIMDQNIYSSFHNLASFINYPFYKDQDITQLSDKGFYCENAFTNELKLYGYEERLINTDTFINEEKIEKFLNENFPSYMTNSPLIKYYPIIPSSYSINNMNYTIESNDPNYKINLYSFNKSYPLLVTCSNNGDVNIYNYKLGLVKLGGFNILQGIQKIDNFSQINDIFMLHNNNGVNNIKSILSLLDYKYNSNVKKETESKIESHNNNIKDDKKDFKINQKFFNNLTQMGFSKTSCKNALKLNGNDFEKALEYLLEHGNQEDPLKNKEKEEGIIGKWQCTICTFMNEKGTKKCEMCENDIPIEKLKEFEEAYKKKNEEKKEEKDDKVL